MDVSGDVIGISLGRDYGVVTGMWLGDAPGRAMQSAMTAARSGSLMALACVCV